MKSNKARGEQTETVSKGEEIIHLLFYRLSSIGKGRRERNKVRDRKGEESC